MQFPHGILRKLFPLAAACAVYGFAGCGNSCFVGFSNNGNGGIIIKGGNPPPVCTLDQAQGMVRLKIAKVPTCVNCGPMMRAEHVYVVVRGVQIRAEEVGDAGMANWIELAPELKSQPRRVDLSGESAAERLLTSAKVPADTYHLVRLEFASEADSAEPECGGVANCVVMADGRIEPMDFTGKQGVVLRAAPESGSLVVLPETKSELEIRLAPQTEISGTASEDARTRIAGEFRVLHEDSPN